LSKKAAFVISLDFELYWGWRDVCNLDSCRERLLRSRSAVSRLLELFDRYGIHATWATVGFLFFRNRDELLRGLPSTRPQYRNEEFSPYSDLERAGCDEAEDRVRYGASIIEEILRTPNQEIGTHTFSHYYCLEKGQDEDAFRSDLRAAVRAAEAWGLTLRSLAFPRNQVRSEYLQAAADLGIEIYRGTGAHWLYRERQSSDESIVRRAMRLLDSYLNISGHQTVQLDGLRQEPPIDIPGSRFLGRFRPLLKTLEPLRVKRICSGLDFAAENGHVYHLWLHPEDLALDQEENFAALEAALRRFATLRGRTGMESLNMGEVAARLLERRQAQVENAMAAETCR